MPYIDKEDRQKLEPAVELIKNSLDLKRNTDELGPGDLNYLLTVTCNKYIAAKLHNNTGSVYQVYNDVIGALEGCKLELYRRTVAPYEDIKIRQNGDVR